MPFKILIAERLDWEKIGKMGICTGKYKGRILLDQFRTYYSYLLLDHVLNTIGEFKGKYIKLNKYGRPLINLENTNDGKMDFNLSHSGHWIVLAISNHKIGIDIEEIIPISLDDLIPFIFNEEQDRYFLENIDVEKDKINAFYSKWVKKESLLKMVGTGLYGLHISTSILRDSNVQQKEYYIEKGYKMAVSSSIGDLPNNIIYKDFFEIF